MKLSRYWFIFGVLILLSLPSCINYSFDKTLSKYKFITTIYTNDTQNTRIHLNERKYQIYHLPKNFSELTPGDAIILWKAKNNIPYLLKQSYTVHKKHKAKLYLFTPKNIEDIIKFLKQRNERINLIVSDTPAKLGIQAKKYTVKKYLPKDTNNYKIALWTKNNAIFIFKNIDSTPYFLKNAYKYRFNDLTIYFNPYTPNCQFVDKIKSIYITFKNPIILSNLPQIVKQTTQITPVKQLDKQIVNKTLEKNIESGRQIIVFLKTYNTKNYVNYLKKYFSSQKIYEDQFSLIIYSKYKSDFIFISQLKDYIKKYHLRKIITNKIYVLKNITDSIDIQPIPTKNNKLLLQRIKFDLDSNNCGLLYFTQGIIDESKTKDTLINLLSNYILNKLSDKAILITSPFLYDSVMIDKVTELNKEYNFKIIYTNKVPTIKHIIKSPETKILWFPLYKDLNGKLMHNFTSKLQNLKLRLFSGKALVVFFNDTKDTKFLNIKKIKELIQGQLVNSIQTPTSIIYYSSFLDTTNLKTLKTILKNDTNKNFFTNNVPFLQNIFENNRSKIHWLPYKCFLPSCALNTSLNKQLADIRVKIILDSALIVYFRDPTDSVFPSEEQLKEEFKFFKFIDFKKGFVIKSYEGH